MKSLLIPLALAALVAAPPEAFGQGRHHGHGKQQGRKHHPVRIVHDRDDDRVFRSRDGRVIVLRDRDDDRRLADILDIFDDDRRDRRAFRSGRGRHGPAFCRSGAGHPVFGRRWCLDKGFGLGDRRFRDRDGIVFRDRNGSIVIDRDGDIIFRPRRLND
ncbi:MAG TPA: hypothetical protein VM737_11275 [Gemmatimonadota bacterium]|nr:hypothetical protein [Gemmatimonadota bacterium]